MTRLEPGIVVWTRVFVFGGPAYLTSSARIGFEPHEVVVDAGERVTVRSLTTRHYRVVQRRELDDPREGGTPA